MSKICACCKQPIFNRNKNAKYCKNCSSYILDIRKQFSYDAKAKRIKYYVLREKVDEVVNSTKINSEIKREILRGIR